VELQRTKYSLTVSSVEGSRFRSALGAEAEVFIAVRHGSDRTVGDLQLSSAPEHTLEAAFQRTVP
jgi:hypothetical protein